MALASLFGGQSLDSEPPAYDRGEHISYSPHWKGGGGGGKGHTKGHHAALSALTLLAFLFFLNILQSCLRDQLANNAPITIMMTTTTTTTTTTGAQRYKRGKGDAGVKAEWKDYVKIAQIPRAVTQQDDSACVQTKRNEPMNSLAVWLQPILCPRRAQIGFLSNMISLTCNATDDGNAKSACPTEK